MSDPRVAVIVPTLGSRDVYLRECVASIRSAGSCHVVVVAPAAFERSPFMSEGLVDQFVVDPGSGPAAAINEAARQLPPHIDFLNWLGDDDQLTPGSIDAAVTALHENDADFVWGSCLYVDQDGHPIGTNRSGSWARTLMKFGPDLIPQPGAMFTRGLFEKVGGLNESYKVAFDYDLFMRFSRAGRCIYIRHVLAKYRWHPDALSAGSRGASVREARRVRASFLPKWIRPISTMWDRPVSIATFAAGKLLNVWGRPRTSRNQSGRTQGR